MCCNDCKFFYERKYYNRENGEIGVHLKGGCPIMGLVDKTHVCDRYKG